MKDDVTGTYVPKTAYLDMIQVRRIENPKGVWRSAGNSDNFHVTLMRLPYDDAEDFKPFNSEGAWSATIVEGGDDFITLRSTVEGSGSDNAQQTGVKSIEGAGEHPIDFWIDFKGTIAENSTPRCAIVRVRYHNYTCEHDIYVRQGYAPITIDGNAESDKTRHGHHIMFIVLMQIMLRFIQSHLWKKDHCSVVETVQLFSLPIMTDPGLLLV